MVKLDGRCLVMALRLGARSIRGDLSLRRRAFLPVRNSATSACAPLAMQPSREPRRALPEAWVSTRWQGESVKANFVLVDYENVQPTDLALLRDGPFKVKVFLGANQSKIPVALATAIQALGANAEYILLTSSGSNALDFHIAYYIGLLSAQDSSAFFHIVSKDTGFDPLIKHLKSKGVVAQRSASIASIPLLKPTLPSTSDDAEVGAVVAHLVKLKAAKPRAQKTLLSTLHALFRKELSEHQLSALFASLCRRGIVRLDGSKVSYDLPDVP